MNVIKVGCAQFYVDTGKTQENLARMERLSTEARRLGCHVVVFPELCVHGFGEPELLENLAEPIPGPSFNAISEMSYRHNIYSVVGFIERCGSKIYNSSIMVGPDGSLVGVYRKTHLWDSEIGLFARGKSFPVFDTDFGKIGMWICYDTRFPAVARSLALKDALVSFVPTAWLARDLNHWERLLPVRALDNFMYVCSADAILSTSGHQAAGMSIISDPCGNILSKGIMLQESIIVSELDLEFARQMRTMIPVLQDRQPELYQELVVDPKGVANDTSRKEAAQKE